MELFVNRETELQLIEDAFDALLDRKRLLRTPIIEFHGVVGIGKTSLLRQVEQRCQETQLPYVWLDVDVESQDTVSVGSEIITQLKKQTQTGTRSAVHATKALLAKGPVVLLFDSVEAVNAEHLEDFLRDVINDEKLFVVLASKKSLDFQQERSIARKLTTLPLKPLDRQNCEVYLNQLASPIEPEVRDLIFEWTRGYPLAMNVMVQAVNDGLDPRKEEGRAQMLARLIDQVINHKVLTNIPAEEQKPRYFSALQLFAVPRRFNLVIMQELIEAFSPELKRESSLAYLGLPKEINEATDALNWNMARAGFSVDEPIRHIFLFLLRSQQPERYFAIHNFLAKTNLRLANEVVGSDRTRYIREYFYHIASNTTVPFSLELLMQSLQIIGKEPPEILVQFREEFSQDKELKETLGSHFAAVQAAIQAHLFKDQH